MSGINEAFLFYSVHSFSVYHHFQYVSHRGVVECVTPVTHSGHPSTARHTEHPRDVSGVSWSPPVLNRPWILMSRESLLSLFPIKWALARLSFLSRDRGKDDCSNEQKYPGWQSDGSFFKRTAPSLHSQEVKGVALRNVLECPGLCILSLKGALKLTVFCKGTLKGYRFILFFTCGSLYGDALI